MPRWRGAVDVVRDQADPLGPHLLTETGLPLRRWDTVTSLFATGGMPMVFLKEFLAADGSGCACCQAIIEAPITVTGPIAGGPISQPWEIALLECSSHQLAPTLGLRSNTRRQDSAGRWYHVIQSIATAWMAFRARVEPGTVVWQASPQARSETLGEIICAAARWSRAIGSEWFKFICGLQWSQTPPKAPSSPE